MFRGSALREEGAGGGQFFAAAIAFAGELDGVLVMLARDGGLAGECVCGAAKLSEQFGELLACRQDLAGTGVEKRTGSECFH